MAERITLRGRPPKSRRSNTEIFEIGVDENLTLAELKRTALDLFKLPKKYAVKFGAFNDGFLEDDMLAADLFESGEMVDVEFFNSSCIPIEQLFADNRWDEARKRLKRVISLKRIEELLQNVIYNEEVPPDVIKALLAKKTGVKVQLHWLEITKLSLSIFQLLVKHMVDTKGRPLRRDEIHRPILVLWRRYLLATVDTSRTFYPLETKQAELLSVSSLEDMKHCNDLFSLWQKTELLIRSAETDGLEKDLDSLALVHTLIKIRAPKVVVWFAMRLHPSQLQLRDEDGRLPLHWAAENNNSGDELHHVEFDGDLAIVNGRLVNMVLERFPEGARYIDSSGRLPLAIVLDNGQYSWTSECVLSLMRAAPQALLTRDTKSHMFPFMSAAENRFRMMYSDCLEELRLSYSLLLENPAAVSIGIVESSSEKYLKTKLSAAEGKISAMRKDFEALKDENKLLQRELTKLREMHVYECRERGGKRKISEVNREDNDAAT